MKIKAISYQNLTYNKGIDILAADAVKAFCDEHDFELVGNITEEPKDFGMSKGAKMSIIGAAMEEQVEELVVFSTSFLGETDEEIINILRTFHKYGLFVRAVFDDRLEAYYLVVADMIERECADRMNEVTIGNPKVYNW